MAGPAAAVQSRYAAELPGSISGAGSEPGGSDKELNPDQPDVVFVKIIPIWLNPRRRHCSRCVAGPAGAVQSRYAAELPAGPDTKLQSRHAAELPAGSDTELNPDQPDLFFCENYTDLAEPEAAALLQMCGGTRGRGTIQTFQI